MQPHTTGSIVEISSSGPGPWEVLDEDKIPGMIRPGQVGIIVEKDFVLDDNDDFFVYKVLIDGVVYTDLDELMFKQIDPR